jgi:hypothetical protein
MRCLKFSQCLVFLMVAIALIQPARAEYGGRVPSNNTLQITIINDSAEPAAVTVYALTRSVEVVGMATAPAGQGITLAAPKPGRAQRIIIEVDPPPGGSTTISVNATRPIVCDNLRDGDTFRIVYDVLVR